MARKKGNVKRAEIEAARRARRRRVYRGLVVTMWLSLLLAAAAGVVEVRRWILASPFLALREVEVEGNQKVAPWEVRVLGGLALGDNLLTIDVDRVAAGIQRHPWVAEVTVRRVYPDRIKVLIRERKPVAVLVKEVLYYVDADATVFSRVPPGDPMDYPVLTGFCAPELLAHPRVGKKAIRDALELVDRIVEKTPLARADVSEVHVDL